MTGKRKRCGYLECHRKVAVIVGECKNCRLCYCLGHRLPEDHKCQYLLEKQRADLALVTKRLMGEKCVDDKLVRLEKQN